MATRAVRRVRRSTTARRTTKGSPREVVEQLVSLRDAGGDGELMLGGGATLEVTNLGKPYFPDAGITKGEVMEYYATVSPALLPLIADRPLILKRYPDGISGKFFFQQNAGPKTPRAVRTASVRTETGARARRIVGGDLATLLYLVQIGAIAVHAWQARVGSLTAADTTTLDLDPGDDVAFHDVVEVARLVKTELDRHGLHGAIKTSGSRGLHIVLPLPTKTGFDDAAVVAERIAEQVVERHPSLATLERRLAARPPGTVYLDAQQNAVGKSVVVAYSVRERPGAPVSMPLEWRELRRSLRLDSFTMTSAPARIRRIGDIWGDAIAHRNTKRAIDTLLRS